jgi:hypothetical protein
MEAVAVIDIYQASYFLLSGCELARIECDQFPAGNLVCTMHFTGPNLVALKDSWFSKRAMVNLAAFRTAYAQVHEAIGQAKKAYTRAHLPQGGAQ